MSPEGKAPYPQGAEGLAVAGDSLAGGLSAEEEQHRLADLAAALDGKIGATIPNESSKSPILEEADEILAEADEDALVPTDFAKLLTEGLPETDYILFPYLPKAARVWAFGPAESSKTIWTQWVATKVTHEGREVVLVSAENPLETDVRQLSRLRPDWSRLRHYHMPAIDLADSERFVDLARACVGAELVVLDTLSALWSGDENSNREVVAFDRDVLVPLVRKTGACLLVVHHSGHPQAFVNRGGVGAGRGASAMGQKADVVLIFQAVGIHEFTIAHEKNRTGGHKEPKSRFRIVDTDDDGLDIEPVGTHIDPRVAECMDAIVEAIGRNEGLSTNGLKAALKSQGFGASTIDPALAELRKEVPARVLQVVGAVIGADGKSYQGKPWQLAGEPR